MSRSSHDTSETVEKADLSASEGHRLLASNRRRLALDVLAGQTSPVDLRELAAGVATREGESDDVDEETIDHVAVTLHHIHLSKMDDAGVVDYDPESQMIDPGVGNTP